MVACLPHTRGSKLCLQMPSTTSAEVPWKRWRSHSRRSISDMRRDMYSFFLLGRERQEVRKARRRTKARSPRCWQRRSCAARTEDFLPHGCRRITSTRHFHRQRGRDPGLTSRPCSL